MKQTVEEARAAVLAAADSYAIAEGSGGDTRYARAEVASAVDDLIDAVRAEAAP